MLPVRPMPVCISSKMSRAPVSSQRRRKACRYPSAGGRTPASPCTGSTSTPAVRSVMASSAPKSLNGMEVTPGTSGMKGRFHSSASGEPIMLSGPMVEPW